MRKISSFNFILIICIISTIFISLLGTVIFKKDITNLLLFLSIYFSITLLFIVHEGKNIINVKTMFVAMYSIMVGFAPAVYYICNGTQISNVGNSLGYQYVMIIIGYLAMALGFYIGAIKGKRRKHNEKSVDIQKLYNFSIILLIISTISNAIYIYANKNFLFGGNLESERITALSSNGIILRLCGLNVIGIGFLYEYYLLTKKKKSMVIFFAIVSIAFYIMRGSRTSIFNIILLIVLLHNSYRPIKPARMIGLALGMLFSIGVLQVLREFMSSSSSTILGQLLNNLQVGSINLNYVYLTFPRKMPFQHGYTFLINILMMLPGPDLDFTLWLKECININFAGGGVTPTILGEGYINFGYPGLVTIMIIIGIIGSKLNRNYTTKNGYKIWASYLVVLFLSVFRSGIANIEISLIMFILIYTLYNTFRFKRSMLHE